jgi:hypothetical protein
LCYSARIGTSISRLLGKGDGRVGGPIDRLFPFLTRSQAIALNSFDVSPHQRYKAGASVIGKEARMSEKKGKRALVLAGHLAVTILENYSGKVIKAQHHEP